MGYAETVILVHKYWLYRATLAARGGQFHKNIQDKRVLWLHDSRCVRLSSHCCNYTGAMNSFIVRDTMEKPFIQ